MKKSGCPFESGVLEALKKDSLSPELRKHAGKCPVCREVVLVHYWMQRFGTKTIRDNRFFSSVPDFDSIWDGAKNHRGIEKELERKALAPLLVPRILSYVFVVIGIVLLLLTGLSQVRQFVISELRMGFLVDVLILMGKKMMTYLPLLGIPIMSVFFGGLVCLLYVLFRSKSMKSG